MLFYLPPNDLTLTYERSGFKDTGRYAEAVSFCNTLAKRSKNCRVLRYGTSPEGRPMIALLISSAGNFTPEAMGSGGRPLLFVQNGIHAGEIEGKDASLILARRMLLEKKEAALYRGVDWIILPVYNVDGHERMSPYNRINQNGPREMGWRSTAQNYNLNRDYMKADAPETKAWLGLVHRYKPDFFIDDHTTDGADFQYKATVAIPYGPNLPSSTANFQSRLYRATTSGPGLPLAPYFALDDRSDPSKGLTTEDFSARYSNGYLSAIGRPSLLVETHVLKDYKTRVDATYDLLVNTGAYVLGRAGEVKRINKSADAPIKEGETVVLSTRLSEDTRPFTFWGYRYAPKRYEAVGSEVAFWEHVPTKVETTIRDEFVPGATATAPAGYAVPAAWMEVIDRLKRHGLPVTVLKKPLAGSFSTFRLEAVRFPAQPFEGRFQPSFTARTVMESRTLPAGSVVVPASRLAMQLLEPEAPDSLLKWGFFNTVFERKEYFEDYAMAPVAEAMLQQDAKLRAEYEAWLKEHPDVRANARLSWLFERSPWADARLNTYPVVRISGGQWRNIANNGGR